ncbi:MAG: autotransporter domain-containing protein [Desulfobacterales bacterium]|nr:MAG: autotransporter domain-containing protein [Desulfobacterales bacterium]
MGIEEYGRDRNHYSARYPQHANHRLVSKTGASKRAIIGGQILLGGVIWMFSFFLPAAVPAIPFTLACGPILNLSPAQVQASRKQPGIYFFPHLPPEVPSAQIRNRIPAHPPAAAGAAYLIGAPENMPAGFEALNVSEGRKSSRAAGQDAPPVLPESQTRFKLQSTFILSNGYRRDDFSWNIAGDLSGNNPNVLSELTWDDLEICWLKLQNQTVGSRLFYLRGHLNYGRILEGDNRDSDFGGDNRTSEFSRSDNEAGDGDVWDASLGVGYPLRLFEDSPLEIAPLIGYSYHQQNLKMRHGRQTLATPGTTPPLGPFPGLNSSYETHWRGPWIGVDLSYRSKELKAFMHRMEVCFSFEYHWADYRGSADWNLRTDLARPQSFKHDADGDGIIVSAGFNIFFNPHWALNLSYDYQDWSTDDGVDKIFFADGTRGATRLNEVNWKSYAIGLGIGYRF